MSRTADVGWRLAILVLVGISACGGDTVTGEPATRVVPSALGPDSAGPAIIAQQWGAALANLRRAIAGLRSRHDDAPSDVYFEHLRTIESYLGRSVKDSTVAVERQRVASSPGASGASRYYTGAAAGPGIIDPAGTFTQFYLPINPEIYVNTAVTTPAMYINNRTTGSYVKMGQNYPIVSTSTLDFQPPDGPDMSIPFIPYFSNSDDIKLLVDCSKTGIEAMATSTHEAGWLVLEQGIIGGSYSTTDTDRGACPHVAPTAHFRMDLNGVSGSDT